MTAPKNPATSGYTHCACRDCFEIAIGDLDGAIPFCNACDEAGCADAHAGTGECLAEGAYGDEEEDPATAPTLPAPPMPGEGDPCANCGGQYYCADMCAPEVI